MAGLVTHYSYEAELLPGVVYLHKFEGVAALEMAVVSPSAAAPGGSTSPISELTIFFQTPTDCQAARPNLTQPDTIIVINGDRFPAMEPTSVNETSDKEDPFRLPPQRLESVCIISQSACIRATTVKCRGPARVPVYTVCA